VIGVVVVHKTHQPAAVFGGGAIRIGDEHELAGVATGAEVVTIEVTPVERREPRKKN